MLSSTSSSSPRPGTRFALECAIFAVLLFLVHVAVYAIRGARDVPPDVVALRAVLSQDRADVLYLGDSSLFMGAPGETDNRSIPAMLQSLAPELSIAEISSPANQMELYELFARHLADHPSSINAVVLPLNMRMLAPQLEHRSYRYFDAERVFLDHDSPLFEIVYRPLAVFKTFDFRSAGPDEFKNAPVYDGTENLGPLGKFNPAESIPVTPQQRRRIETFSYMFDLNRNDLAVRRLETLIETLNRAGISTVLYITPIDVDACEDDLGRRFVTRLKKNATLLQTVSTEQGASFVDLSDLVGHERFAWRYYPNEHMDAVGRYRVAERLVNPVRAAVDSSR